VTGYIWRWFTRTQMVTHPSATPAVHGWELDSQSADHEFDAYRLCGEDLNVWLHMHRGSSC